MNTQTLKLDINKSYTHQTIAIGQGDSSGTVIEATVYDNGELLDEAGLTAKFCMRLPNRISYFIDDCDSIADGVITYTVDESQAAAIDGHTDDAYFQILKGENIIASTGRFGIDILRSVEDGAQLVPPWKDSIERLIDELEEAVDNANRSATSATSAASAANTASVTATQATADANTAAENANDAADDAEAAAQQAAADTGAAIATLSVGDHPLMAAGMADSLSGEAETASWLAHACPTSADGVARVESIKGNTLVWNQLVDEPITDAGAWPNWGVSDTSYTDGTFTGTLTGSGFGGVNNRNATRTPLTEGHVYLYTIQVMSADAVPLQVKCSGYYTYITPTSAWQTYSVRFTAGSDAIKIMQVQGRGTLGTFSARTPQLFDLTLMFGAGNEPATVAEFEALYPASYYPYDAGTPLPVRMTGIETVGFNQWDGETAQGYWDADTGEFVQSANWTGCKTHIPCFPNMAYYYKADASVSQSVGRVIFYDGSKGYLSSLNAVKNTTFTTPANARYMTFYANPAYFAAGADPICINLSWSGYRNGEYEAYWSEQREIPAATYFPDGMRSAGNVRDELTATQAVTRVGVVDLGTLEWSKYNASTAAGETREIWATISLHKINAAGTVGVVNMTSSRYTGAPSVTSNTNAWLNGDKTCSSLQGDGDRRVYIRDDSLMSMTPAEFKQAMSGVMLYYELATPTTTEIDPPLNLTYKVSDFGTERVLVDETQDAPQSAPPIMSVAYPESAGSVRDAALSAIAAVEHGKASTNYTAGSYLVQDGKLYRVTTAIASGETITEGTNVTATTVMDELVRLTQ